MSRREYTAREEFLLRFWRQQELKVDVIAKRLARTPGSVKQKLQRMRLIIRPDIKTRRKSGQLAKLVAVRLAAGKSVTETATELDVYSSVVSVVRKRLGFPAATRSERVKLSWVFRLARGDKPPNRWANRKKAP
jgi:hypothetical protein